MFEPKKEKKQLIKKTFPDYLEAQNAKDIFLMMAEATGYRGYKLYIKKTNNGFKIL